MRFKPDCSATETIKISLMAGLDIVHSSKQLTKVLIRLTDAQAGLRLGCSQTPEDRFSHVKAHMGHEVRKPVFGVSDNERFKPSS